MMQIYANVCKLYEAIHGRKIFNKDQTKHCVANLLPGHGVSTAVIFLEQLVVLARAHVALRLGDKNKHGAANLPGSVSTAILLEQLVVLARAHVALLLGAKGHAWRTA
jgi:hypothetical protein